MDEGTGSSIQDSTGTLAAGSFGSSAPIWSSSTVGVEFTSTSHYIELPAFSTGSSLSNHFTTQSFTINFWFKFTYASSASEIFQYATSAVSSYNSPFNLFQQAGSCEFWALYTKLRKSSNFRSRWASSRDILEYDFVFCMDTDYCFI